jgi:hypothetical protein
MQTCAGKCVYQYGSEKDGLGNVELGGSACVVPGTLDCRVGLGACVYPETCNVGTGKCELAAGQGMATATLTTAFDGITHQFTSRLLGASASCTGASASDYWNAQPRRCTVSVGTSYWSGSSAGTAYAGAPLAGFSVSGVVAGTGAVPTPLCGLSLSADRFALGTPQTCTMTINSASLNAGGMIEGSFVFNSRVTGHGETANASSIIVSGTFRVDVTR